jgi:hypothetical protein
MSRNYTIINYFLNNKNSYKSHMVFHYPYGSILIPVPLLSFPWVFFISSTLMLQMANTRNRNNNNGNNNGENNQDVNPPYTKGSVKNGRKEVL